MSFMSVLKRQLDKIAHASADNMGDLLIFTSVAGWIASSAAQIIGIAVNDKYTKEQKRFMLPQEMADAAINIGSFLLFTTSLKALSSKLVSTGKLAPKKVVEFLSNKGMLSQRGKFKFDVTMVDGFNEIRSSYNGFKNFSDSTAAVVGGIISSNIVTPILRNEYASYKHNKYLAKTKNFGLSTPEQNEIQNTEITKSDKPIPTYKPTSTFDVFRHNSMRI